MTTQLYDPPKVGGDILSWCTKCRMELAHVIVSMVDRNAAKVICKTCKSTHKYKRGAPGSQVLGTAKPRAARKSPAKAQVRVSELWDQKIAAVKNPNPRPYSVRQSFSVGDIIQHSQFGMGLVEEVRSNGKMTVLFRDDQRILVHSLTTGTTAAESSAAALKS